MTELTASRTLVKSPPELWAECSDAASLNRHLDHFGAIRITRLEPETVVAWEGESANGTVRLEPSGWGTRVVLTAQPVVDEPAPIVVVEEPRVLVVEESVAEPPGLSAFARLRALFRRRRGGEPEPVADVEAVMEPATEPAPAPEPDPPPVDPVAGELLALEQALDSLGQAHHRPFSRA